MICSICCEESELALVCSCEFECCQACMCQYIVSDYKEPNCMGCRKTFSREFIMEKIQDKSWIKKEFLPHMSRYLLEQEKMLLPETQGEANLIRKIKNFSEMIQKLPTNVQLQRKFKKNSPELEDALNYKNTQKNELTSQMNYLKAKTVTYGYNFSDYADSEEAGPSTTSGVHGSPHYIMKCPSAKCRGFVTQDYSCQTCELEICKKCHLSKSTCHVCNKDDIETAKLIAYDTKPCPKCMASIFKSGGCDQIFCTACNTAFSWNTGQIEKGIIHNPHFYEWLANNNPIANIEEIACGELPGLQLMQHKIIQKKLEYDERINILTIYRQIIHFEEVVLPEYEENRVKSNFDLRVMYLLNEFDEDTWAFKLMNRDKKRMKNKAIYGLVQTIVIVLKDLIRQFVYDTQDSKTILDMHKELITYFLDHTNKILKIHGGNVSEEFISAM